MTDNHFTILHTRLNHSLRRQLRLQRHNNRFGKLLSHNPKFIRQVPVLVFSSLRGAIRSSSTTGRRNPRRFKEYLSKMKKFAFIVVTVLSSFASSFAQSERKTEFFAGYSFE